VETFFAGEHTLVLSLCVLKRERGGDTEARPQTRLGLCRSDNSDYFPFFMDNLFNLDLTPQTFPERSNPERKNPERKNPKPFSGENEIIPND
jgi:hypothetical protein